MNEPTTSTQIERQKLREELTEVILFRIQQDLEDEIPPTFPENSRRVLLDDCLSNSRHVLSALTVEQLQSASDDDFALQRHTETTIASARFLIHRVREQQRRS